MGKIAKTLLGHLPVITIVTAFMYCAGVEFRINYWRAVGLPLMSSDRALAEVLREGFFGIVSTFAQILKVVNLWVWMLVGGVVYAIAFEVFPRIDNRLLNWLRRKGLARRLRSTYDPEKNSSRFDAIGRCIDRANSIIAPTGSILLTFYFACLIALLAWTDAGKRGAEQGRAMLRYHESLYRQLQDGLVDVSVVKIKALHGDAIVEAVPMSCLGDRCAAMYAGGPISVPKDRMVEESIIKAIWDETCRRVPAAQ